MYQGTLLEFLNMGGSEIVLILVVVLLLFGGKKLPELARGLGKGIREFKDASDGVKREIHRNINAMDLDKEEEENIARNNQRYHPTDEAPVDEKVGSDVPSPSSTPVDQKIETDNQKV
ncbi:Sec-independent protein translocase subunit TatA/TatB [Pedobacter rhizosphaerae]|uniref:Sec-independent protein translocase protein TatA n=1 Tax=Pedobacter rhizosphaerae TaxID=390241 RepID=A0A1H9UY00_9SPHI|nr:twin-arginine translocase TatA/TatE family subunit [Pedobacter rhizosphaerae]SES14316.1 sec-independent protein translocase protein TatA [Pedobacter rhizosphaerae]